MWTDTLVYLDDLNIILKDRNIPWKRLDGQTILVTGATGLIGSHVINALLFYGKHSGNPPHVIAFVRNIEKARKIFRDQIAECGTQLSFAVGDIAIPIMPDKPIDMIIHAASETASKSFIQHPVETINTALDGTRNMLELARFKSVKSFVYLSSMEAYGAPTEDVSLTEDAPAFFSSSAVRSCYPESKRMCEMLVSAYASEYNLHASSIRLAQTFGPGISADDKRVFAYFARRAMSGQDIVLATKGDSTRMYLYTADAVRAILTVLLKGKQGECYNAANEQTYCSVYDMARLVSDLLSDGNLKIVISDDPAEGKKYPPAHKLRLDTRKIRKLGWDASVDLKSMYERMVSGMESEAQTI